MLFLSLLVAGALYFNFAVVPVTPPLFMPTPTPTQSAESFIVEAEKLVAAGKISQAIEAYKKASDADPQNPGILVTLARLQVLYGYYEDALENLETAIFINEQYSMGYALKGFVLGKLELAGKTPTTYGLKSWNDAFTTALELDPNNALALAFRAEINKEMLEVDRADTTAETRIRDDSKRALELDPNQIEVRRARGLVLEYFGYNGEAIEQFNEALKMNKNLAELYIDIARNYRVYPKDAPDVDSAIDALAKAIALRPDLPEPYEQQALNYLSKGDFAKAIQFADYAVDTDPTNAMMHGLLGTTYYRQGNALESMEDFEKAIPELKYAVMGGAYVVGDNTYNIQPVVNEEGSPYINYYVRYAIALSRVGKCGEAVQAVQNLLKVAPGNETITVNLPVIQENCLDQLEAPLVPEETATPEPTE